MIPVSKFLVNLLWCVAISFHTLTGFAQEQQAPTGALPNFQADVSNNIHIKGTEANGTSTSASEYQHRLAARYAWFPGLLSGGIFLEKSEKIDVVESLSYGLELAWHHPTIIAGTGFGTTESLPKSSSNGALTGTLLYVHLGYRSAPNQYGFSFFALYEYRKSTLQPKELPGSSKYIVTEALPLFGFGFGL